MSALQPTSMYPNELAFWAALYGTTVSTLKVRLHEKGLLTSVVPSEKGRA